MPKCPDCGDLIKREDHLKTHMESVHGDTNFECPHCEFITNRKGSLKRHIKIKHGGSAAAAATPHIHQFNRGEPKKKKRRIDEENALWSGELTASDIDMLEENPAQPEDLWGDELTANDIEMLDGNPVQPETKSVEAEPEKKVRSRKTQRVVGGRREREGEGEIGRDVNRGRGEKRKRGEEENEEDMSVKSAFQNKMKERTFYVRGSKDPIGALNRQKKRLQDELFMALKKVGPQKWYIAIKVMFYKMDKSENKIYASAYFHGAMQTLLRKEDFEESYHNSMNKIWQAFDEYLKNGSGWILERVEKILLNTYDYQPIQISSYIPTPKVLVGKRCLTNVQNEDDRKCFEYSIIAALHHHEIDKKHVERPSHYTKFLGQLKGCKEPM